MVMLELTLKVISRIKELNPSTTLIGFKLLETLASKNFLILHLIFLEKTNSDYIIANLLDRIGGEKHFAMIINNDGIVTKCNTKQEISHTLAKLIFN